MSKELIENLRLMAFESVDNDVATMLHQAADALEAKAAPVGERVSHWFSLVMNCAAELETASYCMTDTSAKRIAQSGADHYRKQAGAAYQRQSGEYSDAYQGAREDLAIWKRRALEAEARVRQQDQIIDQMGEDLNAINGPTFMGEPVLLSKRQSGVVMPDVSAMAKVLSDRAADACNIDRTDNWAMYGQEYIDDVQAMLEVARLNGAGSHE